MELLYLAIGAFVVSWLVNVGAIRAHKRIHNNAEHNRDQQVRWASRSKPPVGGIAFYVVAMLSLAVVEFWPEALARVSHIKHHLLHFNTLGLALPLTLAFGMGFWDDFRFVRPIIKFSIQILCGILLLVFGYQIQLFDHPVADNLLTLFWVVGGMNSINMLDNMDGVTGSVGFGVLFSLLALTFGVGLMGSQWVLVLVMMSASVLAFLFLNWHPSKLYMGDTGSMTLGLLLATVTIPMLWNLPTVEGETDFYRQVLLAGLVLIVPITDTTVVTIARLRRGQSPARGGKDHITHHLAYLGLAQYWVPVITGAVTLLSGSVVVSASLIEPWEWMHSALALLYAVLIVSLMVFLYQKGLAALKRKQTRSAVEVPPAKQPEAVAPAPNQVERPAHAH